MSATLETLEMTFQELESCKDAVRKMAYFNWLDAGCPESGQLEFWLKAQREWIERNYVPHRTFDGTRPQPKDESPVAPASEDRQEPGPSTSRRQRRAKVKV